MNVNKMPLKTVKKPGTELTGNELNQINASLFREFKVSPLLQDHLKDRLFFLLKESDEIVAMGALLKVEPVLFNGETFSFLGFVNVVANKKGEGYGKQIVTAMRDYLIKNDLTGFGFCMPKVQEFYEKCGLTINTQSTQRFVYKNGDQSITNKDGQVIFYQDSSNKFMEKILANPSKEVLIPTKNLW